MHVSGLAEKMVLSARFLVVYCLIRRACAWTTYERIYDEAFSTPDRACRDTQKSSDQQPFCSLTSDHKASGDFDCRRHQEVQMVLRTPLSSKAPSCADDDK